MTDFNLYEDLLVENAVSKENEANCEEITKLRNQLQDIKTKNKRLMELNADLKKKNDATENNMKSLIATCRNEINRKNDVIASLRRELDDIILRRVLKSSSSREMRDLIERLKKVLREAKPPKLAVPEPPKRVKPKKGAINVTNFSLDDVYTVKVGNTSFSCVVYGDAKGENSILTVDQRLDVLKETKKAAKITKDKKEEPALKDDDKKLKKVDEKRNRSREDSRHRDKIDKRASNQDKQDRDRGKKSSDRDKKSSERKSRNSPNERKKSERSSKKEDVCEKPDMVANLDTTELEALIAEKQQYLAKLATEQESILVKNQPQDNQKKSLNSDHLDESAQDAISNQSTPHFMENWTASTFAQYRTPPRGRSARQNSNSEIKKRASNQDKQDQEKGKKSLDRDKNSPERKTRNSPNERKKGERSSKREDVCEKPKIVDSPDNTELKAEKQQCLAKPATEQESILVKNQPQDNQKKSLNSDHLDESAQDAISNQSTPHFMENWTASSFAQYRTPPRGRSGRQASDSDSDFNTVAGIAAILKGKLVPGSYVSPTTGMIRTPTPGRDKVAKENNVSEVTLSRTRHRSREVAQEIGQNKAKENNRTRHKSKENLMDKLGLSLSSSSADESSPVKKVKGGKKRKRPSLGFSDVGTAPEISVKRKLIAAK